jgi:hypothetical protein
MPSSSVTKNRHPLAYSHYPPVAPVAPPSPLLSPHPPSPALGPSPSPASNIHPFTPATSHLRRVPLAPSDSTTSIDSVELEREVDGMVSWHGTKERARLAAAGCPPLDPNDRPYRVVALEPVAAAALRRRIDESRRRMRALNEARSRRLETAREMIAAGAIFASADTHDTCGLTFPGSVPPLPSTGLGGPSEGSTIETATVEHGRPSSSGHESHTPCDA